MIKRMKKWKRKKIKRTIKRIRKMIKRIKKMIKRADSNKIF
jgi:uncharacterized lipoprotein YddW (UPF0748 family)